MGSKIIPWFLILSFVWILPADLLAQEDKKDEGPLKIDFDLFHSDNNQELRPRITVNYTPDSFYEGTEKEISIGSYYLEAGAEARLIHAWGTDVNNEPSFVDAKFGLLWNMSHKEEKDTLPSSGPGSLPTSPPVGEGGFVPVPDPSPKDYNYGKLGLKGIVLAEADENAENTNLTGGIECAYSAVGAFKKWLVPLPSLWLNLDYVSPLNADVRKALGLDTSAFPRFRGALLWSWDFGADLWSENPIGKQLAFQLHYRYAKEFDQEDAWKALGFDEYDQINLKLTYRFQSKSVKTWGLRDIYAGYTTGRFIAHEEDDNRVYLGVTLQ